LVFSLQAVSSVAEPAHSSTPKNKTPRLHQSRRGV
jgi:hypothetical protein